MNHKDSLMIHKAKNQITLRGIPHKVLREVQKEARQQRMSVNQVLLKRLVVEEPQKQEGACADLLKLAGTWNQEQANDFEKQAAQHRKIDPELWS